MQLFIGGSNQEKLNIVLADILKNDMITNYGKYFNVNYSIN